MYLEPHDSDLITAVLLLQAVIEDVGYATLMRKQRALDFPAAGDYVYSALFGPQCKLRERMISHNHYFTRDFLRYFEDLGGSGAAGKRRSYAQDKHPRQEPGHFEAFVKHDESLEDGY